METPSTPGEVITFYSYKGGTGRTMALVNVACLLAARQTRNNKVLVMDWDLEAPGLHRFFQDRFQKQFRDESDPLAALEQRPGLIDLFAKLDTLQSDISNGMDLEEAADQLLERIPIQDYILDTDIENLSVLKAGRFGDSYSTRVNTFDWEGLYRQSPYLFRALAQRLAARYRYVLIDSRTGLTDISGICTMLMPEKLVVVFTPNRQSLSGLADLVIKATTSPLKVLPSDLF